MSRFAGAPRPPAVFALLASFGLGCGVAALGGESGDSEDAAVGSSSAGSESSDPTRIPATTEDSGSGPGGGESGSEPPPPPPSSACERPIERVDVADAHVVGDGTPGSCTAEALAAAVADEGISAIRFDCGEAPHTITLEEELRVDRALVLDGGDRITLSGGGRTRILRIEGRSESTDPLVVVQGLSFVDGYTGDLPGSELASGGAGILRYGGSLHVVDCTFRDNVGPELGPDVAGGAVDSLGDGETIIVGSVFVGNRCANGGAIGNLHNDLHIVDSTIEGNVATGRGGAFEDGGNGGGISLDGTSQTVVLCGVTVAENEAYARGGGFSRVSNDGVGPMDFVACSFHGNRVPSGEPSQAGGLYLQGLQIRMLETSITGNEADSTGGMFVWTNPGQQTLDMVNVTIAGNLAHTSLGGGLTVAPEITGVLDHVTIARNRNDGETSFAAGIAGGGGLEIRNSIIADNEKVFEYEHTSCNQTAGGGGNLQWPAENAAGQDERPCAEVTFADPQLGELAPRDGRGYTLDLSPSSPALGATDDCPAADQRGQSRPTPCALGAYEP